MEIVGARMKEAERLGFSRAPILRTMTEFKKHGKPPATGVIPARLPNLPTETGVH